MTILSQFRIWRRFRLRPILRTSLLSVPERMSIACCLWWCYGLLLGPKQLSLNPAFLSVKELAPPWVWALTALSIGLIQAIALLTPASEKTQHYANLLAMFWWAFVAASLAYISITSVGIGLYTSLSLAQWGRLRKPR